MLIGYGTGHGPARRRRRPRLTLAPEPVAEGAAAPVAQRAPGSAPVGGGVAGPSSEPRVPAGAGVGAPACAGVTTDGAVPPVGGGTSPTGGTAPLVISPIVRRLAREHGVDLGALRGTGPGGVIRRCDVEAALVTPPDRRTTADADRPTADVDRLAPVAHVGLAPTDAQDIVIPLTGIRRVIADKLSRSRREIPEVTIWVDADATALLATRAAINAATPDAPVSVLALLARICLVDCGASRSSTPRRHRGAADRPAGRGAPGHRRADRPGPARPGAAGRPAADHPGAGRRAGRDHRRRPRRHACRPARLTGGTFTLNNYGVFGVDGSTPIINHPEAALLGVGRIVDKPWVVDGQLAVRKVTQLSLTFDHRVCDGGVAGGFLRHVADCVEQPALLVANV